MNDEMLKKETMHSHEHSHEHEHTHGHEHNHSHEEEIGCHCCSHCHGEEEKSERAERFEKISLISGLILFAVSFLPFFKAGIVYILLILSIAVAAVPIFIEAFEELKSKKIGENILLVIAVISACALTEFTEAAAVVLFFRVGEMLEEYAINRSKKSIKELSQIRPDTANLTKADGSIEKVAAEQIKEGDIITVMPFERVALDGKIIKGCSNLDTSAITGESIPVEKGVGDTVLSGMINTNEALLVEVTSTFKDSTASRIIDMVENASKAKGKSERIITKFARYYTPIVVLSAALLVAIPVFFFNGDAAEWIHRALVFLVSSCPCAFVISVPLSFFAGIGAASKKGILVKGGAYVEKLEKAQAVVFDKTGTLTTDEFIVKELNPSEATTQQQLLEAAAYAEHFSSHPISNAIVEAYGEVDESKIKDFSEIQARGTSITLGNDKILCGGKRLMEENGIDISGVKEAEIYVAKNSKLMGSIKIEGKLREESPKTVSELKKLGIKRIVMLTGDNEKAAKEVAQQCGIDEYYSSLLPEDKIDMVANIQRESGTTVFVGDGINDAPSLATADIGVAMGLGTDAAIEAGDIILTNSNPLKLTKAIALFKKTMTTTRVNIAFAIIVKIAVLILGAMGIANMWAAVFADVGVTIIAVLNASRLLVTKREN
ncbi:MAG: cadmium-translocating P-type ATPase [Clostridiales bacterium]|nr:cadmium-translocating P-type ATPase [Clostridiales bacterium]